MKAPQIAIASKGGLIRVLNPAVSPLAPESEQILMCSEIPPFSPTDEVNIVGFGFTNGILYACTSSGSAQFFRLGEGEDADGQIAATHNFSPAEGSVATFAIHPSERLAESPCIPKAIALGGENRELEIWESSWIDDAVSWTSVWKAKNVKPTKLGLEVPVWVTCIEFLPSNTTPPTESTPTPVPVRGRRWNAGVPQTPKNTYRIATGTHHSHLRLYDTSVSRRPVFSSTLSQTPILQLHLHQSTPSDSHSQLTSGKEAPETTNTLQNLHFIHTDKNGHFGLYNTHTRRSLGIYKGATGAVLSVTAAKSKEGQCLVAGVGFDRYLWVYEGEERKMVSKVYARTKGTAVVVLDVLDEVVEKKKKEKGVEDGVWDEMEEVVDDDEDERGGDGDDYTGALVKIKRKKGGNKPNDGGKKRRVD